MGQNSALKISLTNTYNVLVPTSTPQDIKQVKIGNNGMQILLGGGFYFIAADRGGSDGPILAFGGPVGSAIKTVKLDSGGLSISD